MRHGTEGYILSAKLWDFRRNRSRDNRCLRRMAIDVSTCFKLHIFSACDVLMGVDYVLTDCAQTDRLVRWQRVCPQQPPTAASTGHRQRETCPTRSAYHCADLVPSGARCHRLLLWKIDLQCSRCVVLQWCGAREQSVTAQTGWRYGELQIGEGWLIWTSGLIGPLP